MLRSRLRQLALFALTVGAIVASALVSQWIWREHGLKSLQAVNEQRLQLAANAIRAEISRQDHLPIVLTLDPDVRNVLKAPDGEGTRAALDQLNRKLAQLSREADTRAMFVINPEGRVVVSSDFDTPDSFVGRNLAAAPYFRNALAAGRASHLGVEPAANRVGYYLAHAIRDPAPIGIAVVRIEFDALEASWARASEHVLVADQAGVAFLASDAGYKFRRVGVLAPRPPSATPVPERYQGMPVTDIAGDIVERLGRDRIVRITSPENDALYLAQASDVAEYGWTIHRMARLETVSEDERDGAIIGATVSTLIIILVLYLVQRHRAYLAARRSGEELKRQVAVRTRELSESNASLKTEIDERRRTETRLRAAQNELVQAGKLAALGQMSAAIAHEINQPLAAIRTFMASTRIFAERGDLGQVTRNLNLITDLAERMANITAHLKTFARKSEPGHFEPVLVDRAVERALVLLAGQIEAAGARLEKHVAPDVWIMGYAVQLEQVVLNLVRNALDALADCDDPWIGLTVSASGDTVSIAVADNGHGIPTDQIDRIFDPFFTTKPIGKGLGLGLSISYGIVQDLGGEVRAVRRPEGGAEMIVSLPRYVPQMLEAHVT